MQGVQEWEADLETWLESDAITTNELSEADLGLVHNCQKTSSLSIHSWREKKKVGG
jgi:hypothetical protein